MKNKNIASNNNNNQTQNTNTMNNDIINYLCDYHEQFGTLPTPVIECTASGTAYTCFGTNLKNKIEKVGGLKELLTTFVGRGAKAKTEAKKTLDEKIQEVRQEVQTAKKVRPSRSKAAIAARAAAKAATEVTA
jgi:hypothetical protein